MTENDESDGGKFEDIIEDYFDSVLERNPHMATLLGVHEYDSEVPSATRESILEEVEEAKKVKSELEELEPSLDRDLAIRGLEYDIYEMDDLRQWESNPQAVDGIFSFLYPLFTRDFAPFEERLELIAERLAECPRYVEETMDRVEDPVELWVQQEIDACNEIPGFFQLIADYAGEMERQDVAYNISAGAEETLDALDEYEEWLQSLETRTDWEVGKEAFEELLEIRGLPSGDEILEMAEKEMSEAESQMSEALDSLDAENPREAIEEIENDYPEGFGEVLSEYREEIEKAREFVSENGIAEIPRDDSLEVSETPEHIAPLIPFSTYFEPLGFEDDKTGKYYVTPPTQAEFMREHNRAEITGSAVSEGYPGHHLQQAWSSRNDSTVRAIIGRFNSFGDEFVEGWRAYSERLMINSGFDVGDRVKLVNAKNRIRSACRAIVGVKLHRGDMKIREGAEFLVDGGGYEPEVATAEVKEYTQDPGHQVSFMVGAKSLEALKQDALNNGYTEKEFHDTVLKQGSIPVEFHRRKILE